MVKELNENMLKALVDITEEMKDAHACCSDETDCNGCPCQIGTEDCVYNYEMEYIKESHITI